MPLARAQNICRAAPFAAAARLALLLALFALTARRGVAANYYWDNNGSTAGFGLASGIWAVPTTGDTNQGWSISSGGTTLPATTTTTTADALNFGTSSLALAAGAVTVSGTPSANALTFGSASGAITFSGGAGISLGGASPTISVQNNNNSFSTPIIFAPSSGGNTISFSLPTSGSGGTLTFNGGISGSGGLTFSTPNVVSGNWLQQVILGAAGTYSGDTTLTAGNINNSTMLQCGLANALPPATVLTIDGGNGAGTGRSCYYDLNGCDQTLGGLASVAGLTLRNQRVVNTTATAATLTLTENFAHTFFGVIGWAGSIGGSGGVTTTANISVVMNGSGTSIFAGNNLYTGDTTISSGTLQLSGTGTLGGGNYAGNITNHGTFKYAGSAAQTLSGNISGSGTLNCSGSGTLTLTGTNALPANLLSGGTFTVSGSGLVTGAVSVNSGGTLSLTNGGSANAVTVNSGGTVSVPDFGTATNLTCASGGALSFNFSATNTVGQLTVAAANGITNSGAANSVTINLTGVVPAAGVYPIINYSGSLRGSGFGAYALGAVPLGKSYTLTNTGSAIQVSVGTAPNFVAVETKADGTGVAVPDTTVITGTALTNFAILRSGAGIFLTNLPATWVLTNLTGAVVASNLVAASGNKSAVFKPLGVGSARILAQVAGTNSFPSGLITSINSATRPFIWVRDSEKAGILEKIATNAWAASLYNQLLARPAAALASHQADRDAFLRGLPVNWTATPPRFNTSTPPFFSAGESYFNTASDCAILYYLTGDTNYAQCAADILQNAVASYQNLAPSTSTGNGGWLIPTDLLYEARQMGCQLPVVYDFIYQYLQTNQVYDVAVGGMTNFSFTNAQYVFRTYYQLVRDHGSKDNNWSALMATCMLNSLLALDSVSERTNDLQIYLTTGSSRQASLQYDYRNYSNPGDIWPESLNYASAVVAIRSSHMVLLERYDPTLNLFGIYTNLPTSLPRISYLRYPNDDMQISFGDGDRSGGALPFFRMELMYQHALARGRTNLTALFGSLINGGIAAGDYSRDVLSDYSRLGQHDEPLELLWQTPNITEAPVIPTLPRTDAVPWAGITLQRNPAPTNNSTYGLMCFVGGAAHTHSHASGMNMELYGLGEVLGAKPGKDAYGSAIHEDYYRIFAAANTIIVNAASQGSGGWSGLGINTVVNVAMEPQAFATAVSSNFSFTCSSFADNMGANAEATQQRTLAIIRTSPTNGFYVDFFRSKSTVTNRVATTLHGNVTNQFHDYIYHNVGSTSVSVTTNNVSLSLVSQPNRFQNDIGDGYAQPGWRYFSNPVVSYPQNQPTRAQFTATPSGTPLYMDMFIAAVTNREFAQVTSPPIVDYNSTADSPAIVVRQIGDAWDKPFAVVYEPHFNANGRSVTNVTALWRTNILVGLKIEGVVAGRATVHYVFSNPNATETYTNAASGLTFKGRFGVVADNGDGSMTLYLGQGSGVTYGGYSVASVGGTNTQAEVRFVPGQPPQITANAPVVVVGVLLPPVIAPVTVSGTNLVVSVATVLGANYVLQSATNLTPVINWKNESTNVGTGGNLILNVPIKPNPPGKFLRFWVY